MNFSGEVRGVKLRPRMPLFECPFIFQITPTNAIHAYMCK
ncbi:32600_t:CDS:2 [Gigaspora margarita]|uniref:32600_t:CDS:1 n=1 Tax=Gigaspora margarita TaxID=4874 RepID=A0ABN7US62_GIGMA|nr:32600_t:CDS:2 [Gigaspora margarita]